MKPFYPEANGGGSVSSLYDNYATLGQSSDCLNLQVPTAQAKPPGLFGVSKPSFQSNLTTTLGVGDQNHAEARNPDLLIYTAKTFPNKPLRST
jgi:hypothetical protein